MSVRNERGRKAATVSHRSVGKRIQVPTERNTDNASHSTHQTTHRPRRIGVQGVVTLRAYPIITEALDGALEAGIHKMFKYVDSKDGRVDEDYVIAHLDTISNYLDAALCEVLDFGDD